VTPNHTNAAASMVSSGYAARAGSEKRSPAVMSTARPTGMTAATVGRQRGSFLARAGAMPALTTTATTAMACPASSA